jgi:hypothetical protein
VLFEVDDRADGLRRLDVQGALVAGADEARDVPEQLPDLGARAGIDFINRFRTKIDV